MHRGSYGHLDPSRLFRLPSTGRTGRRGKTIQPDKGFRPMELNYEKWDFMPNDPFTAIIRLFTRQGETLPEANHAYGDLFIRSAQWRIAFEVASRAVDVSIRPGDVSDINRFAVEHVNKKLTAFRDMGLHIVMRHPETGAIYAGGFRCLEDIGGMVVPLLVDRDLTLGVAPEGFTFSPRPLAQRQFVPQNSSII